MLELKLQVWKKKPEFMNHKEKTLTPEEMRIAATQLTSTGLELCAAGFFLAMTKLGFTAEQISNALEEK